MDCFGSAPCLRCTIHDFSDEADESLFSGVRDHVGGCSLSVWHSTSFISVRNPTDLVRTLTGHSVLDLLSTAFTGVVVSPDFGDHPEQPQRTTVSPASSPVGSGAAFRNSGHPLKAALWSTPQLAPNISSRVQLPLHYICCAALFASTGWGQCDRTLGICSILRGLGCIPIR